MHPLICAHLTRSFPEMQRVYWRTFACGFALSVSWIVAIFGAHGFDGRIWELAFDQATFTWFHISIFPALFATLAASTSAPLLRPAVYLTVAATLALGMSWAAHEFCDLNSLSIYELRCVDAACSSLARVEIMRSDRTKLEDEFAKSADREKAEWRGRLEENKALLDEAVDIHLQHRSAGAPGLARLWDRRVNGVRVLNSILTASILGLVGAWIARLFCMAYRVFATRRSNDFGAGIDCLNRVFTVSDLAIANGAMIWFVCRIYANWSEELVIAKGVAGPPQLPVVIFIAGVGLVLPVLGALLLGDVTMPAPPVVGANTLAHGMDFGKITGNLKYFLGIPAFVCGILGAMKEPKVIAMFQFYHGLVRLSGAPFVFFGTAVVLSIIVGFFGAWFVIERAYISTPISCLPLESDLRRRLLEILASGQAPVSECRIVIGHLTSKTKNDLLAANVNPVLTLDDVNAISDSLNKYGLTLAG